MCGGKRRQRLTSAQRTGSPPRMRGKVSGAVRRGAAVGITPRTCGEKKLAEFEDETGTGSPPHMRGKALREAAGGLFHGITPACAGKSIPRHPPAPAWWDHPRVCGGKRRQRLTSAQRTGSPPRMRGKVDHVLAGAIQNQDHPRMCGEKAAFFGDLVGAGGSPPRMRGKATRRCILQQLRGITPTYAGKSFWRCKARRRCRDHPRTCGEKKLAEFEDETGTGSPPRMRGKVLRDVVAYAVNGITPAYAGKSALPSCHWLSP